MITEVFNVGGERSWLIELRDNGEIVGACGFRPTAGAQHATSATTWAAGGGAGG